MFQFQIISPTKGTFTILVSDEDSKIASEFQWCLNGKGYVIGYRKNRQKGTKFVYEKLHRVILNAKPGQIIDHINRDKLDNRRENLRIASLELNNQNQKRREQKVSSKFKGAFRKGEKMFYAKHGTMTSKTFFFETSAALAYDALVKGNGWFDVVLNQTEYPEAFTKDVVKAYQMECRSSLNGDSPRSEIEKLRTAIFEATGLMIPESVAKGASGPQAKRIVGKSGFRGVWTHNTGKSRGFKAVGQLNNKSVYIGFALTAEAAARAYDAWAVQQFGSAAILNFP